MLVWYLAAWELPAVLLLALKVRRESWGPIQAPVSLPAPPPLQPPPVPSSPSPGRGSRPGRGPPRDRGGAFTPAVGARLFPPALGFVSVPAERRDRSGMVIRVEILRSGSGPAESRAGPGSPRVGNTATPASPAPLQSHPWARSKRTRARNRPSPTLSPSAAPGQDHPAPPEPQKPQISPERSRPAARHATTPWALPTPGGPAPAPAPAGRSDTGRWERGARQIRRKPSGFIGKERSALPGTRLSPSSPH